MNRAARIFVNLLAPPAFAAGLLTLAEAVLQPRVKADDILTGLVFLLIFGYLFGLIPSALHAWFVDFGYRRWAPPGTWRAVGLSSASGLLAGLLIEGVPLLAAGKWPSPMSPVLLILPGLGLVTGFLVGLIIKISCPDSNRGASQPPPAG